MTSYLYVELGTNEEHTMLRLRMDDVMLTRLDAEVRAALRLQKPRGAGTCISLVVNGFIDTREPLASEGSPAKPQPR